MKTCPHFRLRHLLAATLAIGSTFQLVAPVLADGTPAGTSIKNTATGTFTDGTTNYTTTSNEVIIDVLEVAGIALVAQGPSNSTPNAGDTLYVDFVVTNTGNDPTQFFIPGTATLSNPSAFSQNGQLQIVSVNGTALGTAIDVPNAGGATGSLLGATLGSFAATTGTLTIRVPIKASASAIATSSTTVALGNTNPVNTATSDGRNLDRSLDVDTNDIYTEDNTTSGVGGETNATAPSNGVREAMATSSPITVGARLQAFAAVLKAVSSYNNNATPNVLTDDFLTYDLALRVENPATPPAGFVTSDLYGTTLSVNGSTTTPYVLVSDAVPAGLQFGTSNVASAPSGWQAVYTQTPLTTGALGAAWVTTPPTSGSAITRIGFIKDTTAAGISKGGTPISGFRFNLTPIAGYAGGQIANLAQAFGQSQPGAIVPGTSTQIVYDESGDQTTNDGLDGADPSGTPVNNGGISDGVANPTADGVDPGTGTDPTNAGTTNKGVDSGAGAGTKPAGGEVTPYTIAVTPLNGPLTKPAAVGPTDTNDDYTNKSIVTPLGLPPTTSLTDLQTPPFTFDNTAQNTSGGSQVISLLPTPPAITTALPIDTKVTITDPVAGSATYEYTSAGVFNFVSGTPGTGGITPTATSPVKLTIAAGATANYQVTVDLPAAPQFQGFPVPVTAFVDVNGDGQLLGDPSNITIDRLYTNYLTLDKKARILGVDGVTPVAPSDGTFTAAQAALSAAASPGRVIEYRITYTNISTNGGDGNNVRLPANTLVITENGSTGTNNWFVSTFDPKFPGTPTGSAIDAGGAISVTPGGTPTDIQEYRDTISSVLPQGTGTFTFQRKIR